MIAAMTGDEIRAARERKGWTQEELAERLRVGPRTIGNWERGATVPKNRAGMLREVFADEPARTDPIRGASDAELLAELMRRTATRDRATG
jgi:transcriptional regulator with XRE-family HTH domain